MTQPPAHQQWTALNSQPWRWQSQILNYSCALGSLLIKIGLPEYEQCDISTADLITQITISDYWAGSIDGVDMLDKGKIHVSEGMEWDSLRIHHATQNNVQFKTYNCLFFEIFI